MKIRIKNLTKTYVDKKSKKTIFAVNDLSFEVGEGKLIGLLGPSGCGKTTTLYLISGLEIPTSGNIYFDEEDVTRIPPEKRNVGFVFQNYALYPHMSVLENIMFPLINLKINKKEAKERAIKMASLLNISDLLNRKPSEISGGQEQRVAIARALIKKPKVLLLDEPTSSLDARLKIEIREEIKKIQKEIGITTILVTHDEEEAMSICDEIIVMNDGKIEQIGKPQEIYDDPKTLFVAEFLGKPSINIFEGSIIDGGVYIGKEKILDTKYPNQNVFVGIRPEDLIFNKKGTLTLIPESYEIRGKDKILISKNPYSTKKQVRVILDSNKTFSSDLQCIKFSIKDNKMFIFSKDNSCCIK